MFACLAGIMKEFGEGHGVIYVDKPEDALKKAIELIENGTVSGGMKNKCLDYQS